MYDKQRKYPRFAVGSCVRYRSQHSGSNYSEGALENVGMGGLFVATDKPLQEGTVVELAFDLGCGEGSNPIRSTAVVRWRRKRFEPPGMGLEFLAFEGASKRSLEDWLQQHMARV